MSEQPIAPEAPEVVEPVVEPEPEVVVEPVVEPEPIVGEAGPEIVNLPAGTVITPAPQQLHGNADY